ncbi:hypothetical protein [Streptomyces sp. bgisy027]|uniref:hypothetical protein n=1 Tax=Streptomyces sp. bgisy027 TaxID=3413770 RepID=UPI003D71F530
MATLEGEAMGDIESGLGARTAVVGAIGDSASPADAFLISMRLSCRGVRPVNLGTGLTLDQAAAEMSCHWGAEALLLICTGRTRTVVRQLSGLADLAAAGAIGRPVFVGGARGSAWRELQEVAAPLRRAGVAQVLADLADAAYLLPVRRATMPDVPAAWGAGVGSRVA